MDKKILILTALLYILSLGLTFTVYCQSSGDTDGAMYRRLYSNERWAQSDSTILAVSYTRTDYLGKDKHVTLYCYALKRDGNSIRYISPWGKDGVISISNIYDLSVQEIKYTPVKK